METYRFCVINANGTYAGMPCVTYEEARELAAAADGRKMFRIWLEDDDSDNDYSDEDISDEKWDEDLEDDYSEMGYDPYMGCFSDDC